MAKALGGARAARRIRQMPEAFLERVLPGAGRAGGEVVAEEARVGLGGRRAETGNGGSVLIADSVKVTVRRKGTVIRVWITLDGPGAYVGRWLEYGTDPHFISVDPSVRNGRTPRRINELIANGDNDLKATLTINGKPVGTSVFHPGASKRPFLRPALDRGERPAIAAMQAYVSVRASKVGLGGAGPGSAG